MEMDISLYIVKFERPHGYSDNEADFNKNAEVWAAAGFELNTYEAKKNYQNYAKFEDPFICDKDRVLELMISGIALSVERELATTVNIKAGVELEALAAKVEAGPMGAGNEYNTRCEVHMPGQALSLYNDVKLLTDCCTDELSSQLALGWRIIAACPQPDQRRPDYILGMYNHNMTTR